MAAHQAPPSLGFSRQEHWSGLPFPSSMHASGKWKWSHSVMSDSGDPMDCSPPGSSIHGIFQARVLEWGAISFSGSVTQSCLTLCNPVDHSMPGLPVHHHLLEFTQTHVYWVSWMRRHPTVSSSVVPFSSSFHHSQHQGLFQWVNSSHEVAIVLEFQLQHQSFQWTPRTDLL